MSTKTVFLTISEDWYGGIYTKECPAVQPNKKKVNYVRVFTSRSQAEKFLADLTDLGNLGSDIVIVEMPVDDLSLPIEENYN